MQAGKLRVYIGILLGGIGTVQLVFVAWKTLPGILGGNLVQYASYMLEAALFVHTIIFLFLIVLSMLLIYFGKKAMNSTRTEE